MIVQSKEHHIVKANDVIDFTKPAWLSQVPVPNKEEYIYSNVIQLYVPAGQIVSTTINIAEPVEVSGTISYVYNVNITKFEVINYSGQLIYVYAYSPIFQTNIGNPSIYEISDFVYENDNLVPEEGVLFSGQIVINVQNMGSVDTTVVIRLEGLYSYYNIGLIPYTPWPW